MRIHPLRTGSAEFKRALFQSRRGPLRQPGLFLPGAFSEPMPVHVWLVEHEGRRTLIDAGQTAAVHSPPFARWQIQPDQELPAALATIGLGVDDLDTVVLTHMHQDHMDGGVHLGDRPVLVHDAELAYSRTVSARVIQRVLRQPVPPLRFEPLTLDEGSFGAFSASRRLSEDGRIRLVATPGHTPGHASVLCIDDEQRHVLIAGDVSFTIEQLYRRRPDGVAPKPKLHRETLDRVLAHAAAHPLVYLPTHDPNSAGRLGSGQTVSAPPG